jgi:hypothetical protein
MPASAAPGPPSGLEASLPPVAWPTEAQQAVCSSERTLSPSTTSPISSVSIRHCFGRLGAGGGRWKRGSSGGRCCSVTRGAEAPGVRVVRVSGLPRRVFQCWACSGRRDALIRLRWVPSLPGGRARANGAAGMAAVCSDRVLGCVCRRKCGVCLPWRACMGWCWCRRASKTKLSDQNVIIKTACFLTWTRPSAPPSVG